MLVVGCGASARPEPAAPPVVSAQVVGDPTDGGRRRAAAGDRCDYGGAAELTCQRGTVCCYGPPEDPGAYGQCMVECPE